MIYNLKPRGYRRCFSAILKQERKLSEKNKYTAFVFFIKNIYFYVKTKRVFKVYNIIVYKNVKLRALGENMFKLYGLTVNYEPCPTAVEANSVCFGWKLSHDKRGVFQKSYKITITGEDGIVYDGETVSSADSFCITPKNAILPTGAELTVAVAVLNNFGERAEISGKFFTGIKENGWGGAKWIKPEHFIDGAAPYIKRKFITKDVCKAIVYACGLGTAAYYLNGTPIEDYYLDPPFSNYEKTVYYRRFDITDKIVNGGNAFCVLLGEGFYAQNRAWRHYGEVRYGVPCARVNIILTHKDGSKTEISSDERWTYKYSPITLNNVYGGEIYDARLYEADFGLYSQAETGWEKVAAAEAPDGRLVISSIPPVREIRRLTAKSITPANGVKDGAFIIDLGENFAGVAEFCFPTSPVGATYVMRYAETVDESGHLDYRSTGAYANQMIQQDIYIARGDKDKKETYRPRLCYHGFRYIEITGIHDISEGYGTQPKADMAIGIAISTDFIKTGEFTCADAYFDRLYKLMDGTYRSNFIGFPTDCPTRERCGWLGDAQVAAQWGLLNYGTVSAYEKYMTDIRNSTDIYGFVPNIAPGKRFSGKASPLYGAAQVIIPYYAYKYCGNIRILRQNLCYMQSWIEHEKARAQDYIIPFGKDDYDYGDWDPPCGNDGARRMPTTHAFTFMFYEICKMMQDVSPVLGIDGEYYADIAEKVKTAAIEKFYDYDAHDYGFWGSDGAALYLGIYPKGERENLLTSLLTRIAAEEYEMTTAMYGTKYLVPVLFSEGHGETALKFLFNESKPSFATMMNDGATSVWETLAQGAHNGRDIYVLSYNHPMQTTFTYCVYTEIAGLKPTSAGFKTFKFEPCKPFIGAFRAKLSAVSGEISVAFNGDEYILSVPPNASCTVCERGKAIIDGEKISGKTELLSGEYRIKFI